MFSSPSSLSTFPSCLAAWCCYGGSVAWKRGDGGRGNERRGERSGAIFSLHLGSSNAVVWDVTKITLPIYPFCMDFSFQFSSLLQNHWLVSFADFSGMTVRAYQSDNSNGLPFPPPSFSPISWCSACMWLQSPPSPPPGEMLLRTGALNSQLCSTVSAHVATLRTPSAPFGCYDYLTVYHPEEHTAVMELLTAVEKGMWVHWHQRSEVK